MIRKGNVALTEDMQIFTRKKLNVRNYLEELDEDGE
jgi:hypothetical protein